MKNLFEDIARNLRHAGSRSSGFRTCGRSVDNPDEADGPPVVIVNAALARRYGQKNDPIGEKIAIGTGASCDFTLSNRQLKTADQTADCELQTANFTAQRMPGGGTRFLVACSNA